MIRSVTTILWFLCDIYEDVVILASASTSKGIQAIFGITVSPDVGLRNGSLSQDIVPKDARPNTKESRMIDRYRRLIPYMTFYIPTNFPINEYYNFNQIQQQMQQQKAPPPAGGPVLYQQTGPPQQITRLQPHIPGIGGGGRPVNYNHPRYPSLRPNYQAIVYNTRHQTGNHENGAGNNHNQIHQTSHQQQIEHGPPSPPLSFKDANMEVPYPRGQLYQQPQKQTLTPFTNTNKLPGQFTPIIYTETDDGIKPQVDSIKQYEDVQEQHLVPAGPSSTASPIYPIYDDVPQQPERQYRVRQEPEPEQHQELTPQQKYVVYLQQQLLYQNQRQKSQYSTPNYIDVVSSTALPPADNDILYNEKTPVSSIRYVQPNVAVESEEEVYNQIQEQPVIRTKPTRASVAQAVTTGKQTYLEYVEEQQRKAQEVLDQHRLAAKENYKSPMYVTTPSPSYVSSVLPEFKPAFLEPQYRPNPIYRVPNPSATPVRQHLTETTNTASGPTLTTYHPQNYQSTTPQYNSHLTLSRTEKRKLAQRLRQNPRPEQQIQTHPDPILIGNQDQIVHIPSPVLQPRPVYRPDPILPARAEPRPDPIVVSHSEPKTDLTELSQTESLSDSSELSRPDSIVLSQSEQQPDPIEQRRPETTVSPRSESRPDTIVLSRPESRPDRILLSQRPLVRPNPVHEYRTQPSVKPAPIYEEYQQSEEPLPDLETSSLAEILRKLQESNHLPQTLTPDNIDNSIRTLIKILNNLKQTQTIVEDPPQHHEEDYANEYEEIIPPVAPSGIKKAPGPSTGVAGVDYPNLSEIPKTNFSCKEQRYKGFFGDPDTGCQVWHYCDLNGGQASFLCPNGTIFSQIALTCDWWFNVKCSSTTQLYVLNERLYKYILPFTPKFPEDYSGPLVDKYLALKFQEMEEKMRRERLKGKEAKENGETDSNDIESKEDESSEEDDEPEDNSSIDTGLPYPSISTTTDNSNSISPIVVSSTPDPFSSNGMPSSTTTYAAIASSEYDDGPATAKSKISVESEKVEVIEIKTDGSSGHLSPSQNYASKK